MSWNREVELAVYLLRVTVQGEDLTVEIKHLLTETVCTCFFPVLLDKDMTRHGGWNLNHHLTTCTVKDGLKAKAIILKKTWIFVFSVLPTSSSTSDEGGAYFLLGGRLA